ncbi:MAG: DUF3343 domain-containing protein [Syntrophomonas sp.]
MSENKVYILFPNHTEGLRLSSTLRQRGIKYAISPTPRSLSVCCGISLIVAEEELDIIEGIISDTGVLIEKIAKVPIKKDWQYRGS